MADSRLTGTGIVKLTGQELAYLDQFLNAGDRAGRYVLLLAVPGPCGVCVNYW